MKSLAALLVLFSTVFAQAGEAKMVVCAKSKNTFLFANLVTKKVIFLAANDNGTQKEVIFTEPILDVSTRSNGASTEYTISLEQGGVIQATVVQGSLRESNGSYRGQNSNGTLARLMACQEK